MSDIIKENKKYFNAVLQSVSDLHETEAAIENGKSLLTQFTDSLTKNADEIGKFQAVENEIIDYLKQFSFTGKIDFSPVKNKLQPLPELKGKLVEMGKEAQKLAGLPDRYNCFKAIEVCQNLFLFCRNEMKSADYNRITTALDTNIPKLFVIQKEFEKEKQILADIKNVLKNNSTLLVKYTSFNNELQQFVATFPNNRDTDLKTIEQRITVLNDINKQVEDVEKILTQIKPYADRYNKNAVSKQVENLLSFVYAQMKFNDVSNAKTNLQQALTALKTVISNFDKEQKDTTALCDKLKKKQFDLWEEDGEILKNELNSIISKGTETQSFDLQNFHNRIQTATNKKTQDIDSIYHKYKWLRRKCYDTQVNSIKNKHLKSFIFQSEIESIRKSRGLFTKLFEMIFYN